MEHSARMEPVGRLDQFLHVLALFVEPHHDLLSGEIVVGNIEVVESVIFPQQLSVSLVEHCCQCRCVIPCTLVRVKEPEAG